MSLIHTRIAEILASEVERRGCEWGEPPALYLLTLDAAYQAPSLLHLPIHPRLWELDRTAIVLARVARQMPYLGQVFGPRKVVHGIAFRTEGWQVYDMSGPGTAGRSELAAAAMRHDLHNHPRRVEVRFMIAVDREGMTYTVEQERGKARASTFISGPGADEEQVTGSIVQSLDAILWAVTGIKPPDRTAAPSWSKGAAG